MFLEADFLKLLFVFQVLPSGMIVDTIIPLVTFEGQDTLLDIYLQPVVIRSNKISKLFPA